MDVKANLRESRELAANILRNADSDTPIDMTHESIRLAELVDALHAHVARYGWETVVPSPAIRN